MPNASPCPWRLIHILKMLGIYRDNLADDSAAIAEANGLIRWFALQINEVKGIPHRDILAAVDRLAADNDLDGWAHAADLGDYAESFRDLNSVAAGLSELDDNGSTGALCLALSRQLLARLDKPAMNSLHRVLFGGNGDHQSGAPDHKKHQAAAVEAPRARDQLTLRARVSAFITDRAEALHRLPTLDEVYSAFPQDDLGARATFYRNNPWYKTIRAALQTMLQNAPPQQGHRINSRDETPGTVDASVPAPQYHRDETS